MPFDEFRRGPSLSASARPTSSTRRSSRRTFRRMRRTSCARALPACCGRSSSITTWSTIGWRAIRAILPRLRSARNGRNHEWTHLYNADVISMPDKWEYPWYAAWDLAFHCIPLALVDSDFAKEQLILMLREWYMHPNGQMPAYEWAFGDVNPPVHAWAAWRVYKIDKKRRGKGDREFLQRVFHKLLLNFTWWVNRKDADGMNIFQGGFLGLDNIGVFDRSAPLPTGGYIEQSDGTSWMAMYTLNLLAIALELAQEDPAYEDVASKFWEHFIYIAHAMNHRGHEGIGLWNEEDGFFYDVLQPARRQPVPHEDSLHGGIDPSVRGGDPGTGGARQAARLQDDGWSGSSTIVPISPTTWPACAPRAWANAGCCPSLTRTSSASILKFMLDEREFLSPYGIRALSQFHRDNPYMLSVNDMEHRVDYEPGESTTGLFGGNSNWRGPIWFPVNYLLVESLQKFHHYLGDDFKVECPDRLGKDDDPLGSGGRIVAPHDQHLPAGREGPPAGIRQSRKVPDRSALARPGALSRVFPRRLRRRRRRQPSDRMDRCGDQADAAERRIPRTQEEAEPAVASRSRRLNS